MLIVIVAIVLGALNPRPEVVSVSRWSPVCVYLRSMAALHGEIAVIEAARARGYTSAEIEAYRRRCMRR